MKTRNKLHSLLTLLSLFPCMAAFAQSGNYFAGTQAGASNTTGSYNSYIGYQAGFSGTTNSYNTLVGFHAGKNNQGIDNNFFGYKAGFSNTTGYANSFFGNHTGAKNLIGHNNSFFGDDAGSNNTEGSMNSFYGGEAGFYHTKGLENSFFGYTAGYKTTIGNHNTFVGAKAGYGNAGSSFNSYFGNYAGYNSKGSYNTFSGYSAGTNNAGNDNSFYGAQTGLFNTTGVNNSFFGRAAGYNNTEGFNNNFFGFKAGISNTTAVHNNFVGSFAGYNTTTGPNNTFIGYSSGQKNKTGSNNTMIGNFADISMDNLSNATAIGYRSYVSASNSLVLGSINGINGATLTTKVGIGTSAPAYLLQVNGVAAKPGGGPWTAASDQRLKQNVKAFEDGLQVLQQIKPVWFKYNGKAGMPTDKEYVGIIAQEMQQIAPYTVGTFTYQDTTGRMEEYLDYDATALTYILVNAVKEQQQLLEEKDQKIQSLENRLLLIEKMLNAPSDEKARVGSEGKLEQNMPNPFTTTTTIAYEVPATAASAYIKLYTLAGQELKSYDLTGSLRGEVSFASQSLPNGTYVYSLLIDGKVTASKKMIIQP